MEKTVFSESPIAFRRISHTDWLDEKIQDECISHEAETGTEANGHDTPFQAVTAESLFILKQKHQFTHETP